jgi:NAD(P)-dependent dehydrogenase (short-subunit alcohol dehydrogenase family)
MSAQAARNRSGRLAGRRCVITGHTGMAGAAAQRFRAEGADVFVISLEADDFVPSEDSACADLRHEDEAVRAFAAARRRLGRLDAVLAVAGGSGRRFGDGPLHTVSHEAWDATMALNLTTTFLAAREAVRWMSDQSPDADRQRGSIVLISSALAFDPSPHWFATHAYTASKAAIVGLMRTTAAYYAEHGIRINALAPATVDTPMAARAANDPATVAHLQRKQPLSAGLIAPDDVVDAALYLCSWESRMVTGQTLTVDGGWSVSGDKR